MAMTDLMPWNWGKKSLAVGKEEKGAATRLPEPFVQLWDEMNTAFEGFWNRAGFMPDRLGLARSSLFDPKVDITEGKKEIVVSVELPGMDEKDIEVHVSPDHLMIRGEKRESREEKNKDHHLVERTYGSFSRTIPLPRGVDRDKATAEFKKGILTVHLVKNASHSDDVAVKVHAS